VIALIDYGAGNLTSVRKALTSLGADFVVPRTPADCDRVGGVIVPGVGHFAATAALEGEWRDAIARQVAEGTPLLGICLGLQWLFEGSDEAPDVRGLGALPGRIVRLHGDAAQRLKIPHVGWNALEFRAPAAGTATNTNGGSRLLSGLNSGAQVYFTHSYAAPVTDACVAASTHAETFAAVVERDNIFGVQFHPEKSSDAGLTILGNFLRVCRSHLRAPRDGRQAC
jgi:imidazole glycerol-phosphate synthase subunit HisH